MEQKGKKTKEYLSYIEIVLFIISGITLFWNPHYIVNVLVILIGFSFISRFIIPAILEDYYPIERWIGNFLLMLCAFLLFAPLYYRNHNQESLILVFIATFLVAHGLRAVLTYWCEANDIRLVAVYQGISLFVLFFGGLYAILLKYDILKELAKESSIVNSANKYFGKTPVEVQAVIFALVASIWTFYKVVLDNSEKQTSKNLKIN